MPGRSGKISFFFTFALLTMPIDYPDELL